ncbi:TetR/AcrR family transcriptional regulator [Pseudonocardia sp. CA-107938]|uniref:TetR/AcrR family transcriptional regulator n=1 Tax=Pseudonocardia sp. CA-107938 TaxID=3240021 RepID=UPI003D92B9FE
MLTERAQVIADAAIAVLGEQGSRALTHRAVDHRAGLPTGSTSNIARTRAALLTLTVERFIDLNAAAFGAITDRLPTRTADLARLLAEAVDALLMSDRTRMIARYELAMEAVRRPELQQEMNRAGAALRRAAHDVLTTIGSTAPDRHARQLNAFVDGLVFHVCVAAEPAMSIDELTAVFREFLDGMLS